VLFESHHGTARTGIYCRARRSQRALVDATQELLEAITCSEDGKQHCFDGRSGDAPPTGTVECRLHDQALNHMAAIGRSTPCSSGPYTMRTQRSRQACPKTAASVSRDGYLVSHYGAASTLHVNNHRPDADVGGRPAFQYEAIIKKTEIVGPKHSGELSTYRAVMESARPESVDLVEFR